MIEEVLHISITHIHISQCEWNDYARFSGELNKMDMETGKNAHGTRRAREREHMFNGNIASRNYKIPWLVWKNSNVRFIWNKMPILLLAFIPLHICALHARFIQKYYYILNSTIIGPYARSLPLSSPFIQWILAVFLFFSCVSLLSSIIMFALARRYASISGKKPVRNSSKINHLPSELSPLSA